MKNIIILLLISVSAKAQTVYQDATLKMSVVNIKLTDSASMIYDMPLKMHIDIFDRNDSVNGVTFNFSMYSVSPQNPTKVHGSAISISGAYYNAWDANDNKDPYKIVQAGLKSQGIIIEFKNILFQ